MINDTYYVVLNPRHFGDTNIVPPFCFQRIPIWNGFTEEVQFALVMSAESPADSTFVPITLRMVEWILRQVWQCHAMLISVRVGMIDLFQIDRISKTF